MSLPTLFRQERERQGLSRSDVARLANIAPSIITRVEEGENLPRTDTLARIGIVLGIPAERVFGAVWQAERQKLMDEARERMQRIERLNSSDGEPASVRRLSLAVAGG